jgi:hypothetical protein
MSPFSFYYLTGYGTSVVSQFEFLVPLHQGARGQTETLPEFQILRYHWDDDVGRCLCKVWLEVSPYILKSILGIVTLSSPLRHQL